MPFAVCAAGRNERPSSRMGKNGNVRDREEEMPQSDNAEAIRAEEWAVLYRKRNPAADRWSVGYGAIHHAMETQARVFAMAELLAARGVQGDGVPLFDVLYAADRLACGGKARPYE